MSSAYFPVARYFKKTPEEALAGIKSFRFFGTKGWEKHLALHEQQMQALAEWLLQTKKIPSSAGDVTRWRNVSFLPK